MDITPRLKHILTLMLQEDKIVSVKSLSDQIGISKRTVQRELGYVESSLSGYDITFRSKTGAGVWLEGSKEEKQRLFYDVTQGDTYDVSNREERRKGLLYEILMEALHPKEKGLKKLFYYSSRFQVSETTISADLEAIEEWLAKYGLQIVRKPGSGIYIDGREEYYRRAIRGFISENVDAGAIKEAYAKGDADAGAMRVFKNSSISQILDDEIINKVVNCIIKVNHKRVMGMTESSYTGLVLHVSIAVNRILMNETIEPDTWEKEMKEDEDYQLAKTIAEELERAFSIRIPDIEVAYICLHIKGAKHEKIQWKEKNMPEIENRDFQKLINDMIDAFDKRKAFLLKQDDEFIQGLLAHLQPTLIRIIYQMPIRNPVLKEIKQDYCEIYERCEKVASVLRDWIHKEVPEDEIGFLAVHFGAALVRLEGRTESIRQVQVGVVCSSGIGISRLMSSKLKNNFKGRMEITAYGKNDITPYIMGRTDFFVSSIPLGQQEIPVVYVNPLLSDEDLEKIGKILCKYERMPRKWEEENEFTIQLEKINTMTSQINGIIKYMEFFQVDNNISFEKLLVVIGEKLSPYSDLKKIIQEDIQKREQISSQIFAEFGFALLHAKTKGVIRPIFAVCMTKNLKSYRDPYFKGIHIVLVMLVPDDENSGINNEIMGYLSSMLIEEPEILNTIGKGDKEEIRMMLSKCFKQFFQRYLNHI